MKVFKDIGNVIVYIPWVYGRQSRSWKAIEHEQVPKPLCGLANQFLANKLSNGNADKRMEPFLISSFLGAMVKAFVLCSHV